MLYEMHKASIKIVKKKLKILVYYYIYVYINIYNGIQKHIKIFKGIFC